MSISIPKKALYNIIKDATDTTKNPANKSKFTLDLSTNDSFKAVEVTIPKESFVETSKLFDGIVIQTKSATITFDKKAFMDIANAANADIKVNINSVDASKLSEGTRAIIGDRPVYDFTITSGDKTISNFNGGRAAVSIPYTLKPGEKQGNVIVYYINNNGVLETVKNCNYDGNTGTVNFSVTHFSKYAVASKTVGFSDVPSGEWFSAPIEFVAARELFSGVGEDQFAPYSFMTRAMFVSVLSRIEGSSINGYRSLPFTDVDINEWYGKPIAWAYANKIINTGVSLFNPNEPITREEMALILYNYIIHKNISMPVVNEENFSDMSSVSNEAKEAVSYMKKFGLISGVGSNTYAPQQTATRAQVAQIFMNLIKLLSK